MTSIQIAIIDATYKIIDNKPVIILFAKTKDGKKIIIEDSKFQPYFICITNKDITKEIEKLKTESGYVTKVKKIDKTFNGKKALKIYTNIPKVIPEISEEISSWPEIESINEYDILYVNRYLIDKQITPFTYFEAELKELPSNYKLPRFNIESIGEETEDLDPTILGIDIETYVPEDKLIDPQKYPILMIALYSKDYKKVISWKNFPTENKYFEFVESEAELIERTKEIINKLKPDIITGYASDNFDLPYIKTRAKKYKLKLDLGLDYSELSVKKRGITETKINGICHIDCYKFARKFLRTSLSSFTLNNVAKKILEKEKDDINIEEISEAWDENKDLEKYAKYNLKDAELVYELCQKFMPNIIEMIKIIGQLPFDVSRMSFSQAVEWYLIRKAYEFKKIVPNKPSHREIGARRMASFEGGFVRTPIPGLYQDIAIFDFKSLYPSLIVSHNISPETLNCECCKENTLPGIDNKWFCKKKKGFIPTVLEEIITRRMRIKELLKQKDNTLLKARSESLKVLANSFYGYLAFPAARWYNLELAEIVTSLGRSYIQDVIKKAEEENFKVVYSDTDSVFILLEKRSLEELKKFQYKINENLPGIMELEYEGFYPRGLFVATKTSKEGAKKKYALLTKKGKLEIKGFESIRRNWSPISKEVQEKVLHLILTTMEGTQALSYFKEIEKKISTNQIPKEKMIITTTLTKDLENYDSKGPHVKVAKRIKEKGQQVKAGQKISYIIAKGTGSISEKARLPEETDNYDGEYYLKNQIYPSLEKIFEVIGIEIIKKNQKKLESFF